MPPVKKETIEFEVVSNLDEHLKLLEQAYQRWEKLGISIGGINKEFDNSIDYLLNIDEALGLINKNMDKQKTDLPKVGRMMIDMFSSSSKEAEQLYGRMRKLNSEDYEVADDEQANVMQALLSGSEELLKTMTELDETGFATKQQEKSRKIVHEINKDIKKQLKYGTVDAATMKNHLKNLKIEKSMMTSIRDATKNTFAYRKLSAAQQIQDLQASIAVMKANDGILFSSLKILGAEAQIVKLKVYQKMGKGLEAAKGAAKGVMGAIGKIPGASMLAVGGVGALVELFTAADTRVKKLQRDTIGLAMATGKYSDIAGGLDKTSGKSLLNITTKTQNLIYANQELAKILSVNEAQIMDWQKGLTAAGYRMDFTSSAAQDAMRNVAALGMRFDTDFTEMTDTLGTFRADLGYSMDRSTDAVMALAGGADAAGMTMSRFLAKVTNAGTGLAIYGTRIEDVGNLFVNLKDKFKLPEDEAAKLTESIISGWKDMDAVHKVMITSSSSFAKNVEKTRAGVIKGQDDYNARLADFMKITGKVGKEGESLFKQWVSGYLDVTDVLSRSNPANWLQTQLEFAMKTLSVDMKVDMDTLAKKMENPMAREKLFEIAGLSKETTAWMQKMWAEDVQAFKDDKANAGKQLNFNDWMKGFQEKYEAKTSQEAKDLQKKTNEAIAAQSRPVTDAIEQMIERWLSRLYIYVRKIFAYLVGNDADEASIALEEKLIKLNEQKRDIDRKIIDESDKFLVNELKIQQDKIAAQIAETNKTNGILTEMQTKGEDKNKKWMQTLEKKVEAEDEAARLRGEIEKKKEKIGTEGGRWDKILKTQIQQLEGWADEKDELIQTFKDWMAYEQKQAGVVPAAAPAGVVPAAAPAGVVPAAVPSAPGTWGSVATPPPDLAKDVEIKSPGYFSKQVQAGDLFIDKKSMADFRAGPRGAAIPAYAAATGAGNTINDNRNVQIIINQRDAATITQLVREAIYTDKMAR